MLSVFFETEEVLFTKQGGKCVKHFSSSSFKGFIAVDATLPTFTWLKDKSSTHGVPHLQIHFPDGGQG
jgi:hypothetical protein